MTPIIEICCGDMTSVRAACEGGADRIELCSGLSEGGLTPSTAFIEAAVATGMPVNVLIRHRPGDFLYDETDITIMLRDIRLAVSLGANGVVVGALLADGSIHTDALRRMVDAAGGRHVTFHRAFDLCSSPRESLATIASAGCDTILTSGLAPAAADGLDTLRGLVAHAAGRIGIMAGAGINQLNARAIAATGVAALHASARMTEKSRMAYRRAGVPMGAPGTDEYSRQATSAEAVRRLKAAITE